LNPKCYLFILKGSATRQIVDLKGNQFIGFKRIKEVGMSDAVRNKPRPFRLGEVESLFDSELVKRKSTQPKLTASMLIRWCIRQALTEQAPAIAPEQAEMMLDEIRMLRRDIVKVGRNFNQIAHYFNIHSHLIESDLSRQHKELKTELDDVVTLIRKVESGIIRRTY
jgi:hypothetical protein